MSDDIHNFYDKSYKNLFSYPTMIQDLLKGFVDQQFINDIDYDKIEKLNVSYVSKQYKETESDLILKLDIKGEEAYLYVLLELQSSVDKYMALRTLSYILGFYDDLIKQDQVKEKLPPVFPIVLYTGVNKYTAPIHIQDIIEHWKITDFIPTFKYYKIAVNEGKEKQDELILADNVVAALFKLISSKTNKEFREAIRYLCKMVKSIELRKEIFNFIKHFLIKKNVKIDDIPFEEGGLEMLETLIDRVKEEGYEEGREEGIEKGIEKGKVEGKYERNIEIARNLLNINMPVEQIALVTSLSVEEIQKLSEEMR